MELIVDRFDILDLAQSSPILFSHWQSLPTETGESYQAGPMVFYPSAVHCHAVEAVIWRGQTQDTTHLFV
jgi:hypothetical protein